MRPLLEEARVIDDPGRDGLALLHGLDRVLRGFQPDCAIVPLAPAEKVAELAVNVVGLARVGACPGRDRLCALAFAVAEDAECVHRERLPLPPVLQVTSDAAKDPFEPSRCGDFRDFLGHESPSHKTRPMENFPAVVLERACSPWPVRSSPSRAVGFAEGPINSGPG